ncbi:MAG: hypothetical protein JWN00_1576, partial [Actinomycetia bacterium]|nr:hypothetical protein [Actinomycetes bacterium]
LARHAAGGKPQPISGDTEDNDRVTDQDVTRLLGLDFVAEHRQKYGRLPPEQRQLTYDIAANDRYAPWRLWLDDQFALLPRPVAVAMARRMWLDEHFWPVNFELAAGAGLRATGLEVAYERDWGGATPDWTVLAPDGKPLAFVEVHTDMPPASTFAQMRAWHGLVERIKNIPVGVVLHLAPSKTPVRPPDARTAKRVAQDLNAGLLQQPPANVFFTQGYTFLVAGDPRRGGRLMASPLGMHACFDPPSSRSGPVSATRLMERVEDKVRIYRDLADAHEVPLIVAVGAHRFTGVTLEQVRQQRLPLAARRTLRRQRADRREQPSGPQRQPRRGVAAHLQSVGLLLADRPELPDVGRLDELPARR